MGNNNNNLLIIGAGQYGMVTKEVAKSMGRFGKIDFLDDNNYIALGKIEDYTRFINKYRYAIVAIGNPDLRDAWLNKLVDAGYEIPVLIHKKAYVSPSAEIGKGSVIEPMAVVHTDVIVGIGCFISAGAILNHNCILGNLVHINCGSIVNARVYVKKFTRTECGTVLI